MEIPNFLIAGAAKSGTSWIHQCLREHPEVFVPRRKEVRFFSVNYEKGERWYLNFFKNRSNEKAIGEASPSYLSCEDAPDRIYKWNPNMKIIFVLRDPVERACSHYKMLLRSGNVDAEIKDAIDESSRFIKDSFYKRGIKKYIKKFGGNKINIFFFEDLKEDNEGFIKKVYRCLSVDESFTPSMIGVRHNKTRGIPKRKWALYIGKYIVNKTNSIGDFGIQIVDSIKNSRWSDYYNKLLVGESRKSINISHKEKKLLSELFSEDVNYVSHVTGRSLNDEWIDRYK